MSCMIVVPIYDSKSDYRTEELRSSLDYSQPKDIFQILVCYLTSDKQLKVGERYLGLPTNANFIFTRRNSIF